MKNFLIFLLLFSIPGTAWTQFSEGRENPVLRVGLSSRSFEKINRNDASAALRAWVNMVIKEQDLKIKAEVTLYDSFDDLDNALRQSRVDAFFITVEESMLQGMPEQAIFLPARKKQGLYIRYAVIVHRNSDIPDMKSLMGCTMVIHDSSQMILSRQWLKSVLTGHTRRPIDQWLGSLTTTDNPSKAILQVYFRQTQAALVTMETFKLACELNPQLRKELKMLSVSPPFIPSFFMFRPTYRSQARQHLEAALTALETTAGGRQLLTVFHLSGMEKQPPSILETTRQFLTEYQRLENDHTYQGEQP